MRNHFVGYPVQDNLAGFPEAEALRILADLNATRADRARCQEVTGKVNFAEWMHYCFGDELTKSFGRPYNFKVWAHPAERMNSRWVGERVATIDVDDVAERYYAHVERTGWGPNALFRYPQNGTGSIWRAVHASLPQHRFAFNARVTRIDSDAHTVQFDDGALLAFDRVISSMPIDQLGSIVSPPLSSAAQNILNDKENSFLRQVRFVFSRNFLH